MKNFFLMSLAVGLLVGVGCGPIIDEGGPGALPGPVCYVDEDCVPNGCCGEASNAVHVTDAPSCRGISCTGTCPDNSVDCGCGIPICRDQRCTVARTVSSTCSAD